MKIKHLLILLTMNIGMINCMELFVTSWCPFCTQVENVVKELKLDIKLVDVGIPSNKERLLKLGGKPQIPFLLDGSTKLYESSKIIAYLKKHHR